MVEIHIERCDKAQAFCDRCFGKFFIQGLEDRPCFSVEDSGEGTHVSFIIDDGEKTRQYSIPRTEFGKINEPSRDITAFEVPLTEGADLPPVIKI